MCVAENTSRPANVRNGRHGVPTRLLPCGERSSPDIREVFRLRETELGVRDCDDAAGRNPSVGKGFAFFDGLRARRIRRALLRSGVPHLLSAGQYSFAEKGRKSHLGWLVTGGAVCYNQKLSAR